MSRVSRGFKQSYKQQKNVYKQNNNDKQIKSQKHIDFLKKKLSKLNKKNYELQMRNEYEYYNSVDFQKLQTRKKLEYYNSADIRNSGIMTCYSCYYSIISQMHKIKCIMIEMMDIQSQTIENAQMQNFKTMMTYGLQGCTVMLLIKIKNGKITEILLGHHPFVRNIVDWFNDNYSKEYNYITVIKLPADYVKKNDEWILEPVEKNYFKHHLQRENNQLILESYSINADNNNFRSSFYCFFKNNYIKYLDNYGCEVNLFELK
jgi:hypothetical protein